MEATWGLAQITSPQAWIVGEGLREEEVERQTETCVSGVRGFVCNFLDGSG